MTLSKRIISAVTVHVSTMNIFDYSFYSIVNIILAITLLYTSFSFLSGPPINPYQSWVDSAPALMDLPRLAATSALTTAGSYATLLNPITTSATNGEVHASGSLSNAELSDTNHSIHNHSSHSLNGDDLTAAVDIQNFSPASPSSDQCSMSGSEHTSTRKRRHPVPDDKKDEKYWERRKRNNQAAKRSRDIKRKKTEEELTRAQDAVQENVKLKQEIEVLKAEISSLRRLLKDANMTLSLWIRARQASETATQLPPMLRNPNMSFVTFPVPASK